MTNVHQLLCILLKNLIREQQEASRNPRIQSGWELVVDTVEKSITFSLIVEKTPKKCVRCRDITVFASPFRDVT